MNAIAADVGTDHNLGLNKQLVEALLIISFQRFQNLHLFVK